MPGRNDGSGCSALPGEVLRNMRTLHHRLSIRDVDRHHHIPAWVAVR
jgi:hypothetical protein